MTTRTLPPAEISQAAFEKLEFASRISGKSFGQIIDELIMNDFRPGVVPSGPEPSGGLRIFKIYKGQRFDGFFDPETESVTLTSEPFDGRVFKSPTAAAVSIVKHVSPGREFAETNGFRFFKLLDGRLIDALRQR